MTTIHPTMKRVYQTTGLTQTELARAINVSPQNVHNWEKRGVSKKALLLILTKFNLNPTWIETGIGSSQEELQLTAHSSDFETIEHSSISLIPVKSYTQMENDGYYKLMIFGENHSLGLIPAIKASPQSYAIKISSDLFYPAIRSGWYIVCDPIATPSQTEFVEVTFTDGRKTIQEFIGIIDGNLHLISVNGNKRTTFDMGTILKICPVTDIVPPSRLVKS